MKPTKEPFTAQINFKMTKSQEDLLAKAHDLTMLKCLQAGLPAPIRADFVRKTLFTVLLAMVENAEAEVKG